MQKKIYGIIKALAFIMILALSVSGVYKVLRWKDTSGSYISSVDMFYATDDNLIDVVFFGSSHTYCSVYPAILWEDAGIAAFDMSVSGQDKNSTYYSLLEFLKTQSPRVVMIDCYGLLHEEHKIGSNVYRNYLSMKFSLNSIKHVNAYIKEDQRKDYIARFPIVHTRYKELEKNDFVEYAPNKFGRGAYYAWHSEPTTVDYEAIGSKNVTQMSESNKKWIDDLQELSEKYGFELEFFFAPSYVNEEQQAIINTCNNYFDEKGIVFTDFNQKRAELGISDETDYIDGSHLNAYGATKLTRYLEDRLVEVYNLESHAGDSRYSQWDEDCEWMRTLEVKANIEKASTAQDYVKAIMSSENTVTVISLEGDLASETSYFPALQELGMTYDEYLGGGKWLYSCDKLVKVHDNVEGTADYELTLGKYDTLKVGYYGLCEPGNIMLNRENYQIEYNVTFLTYSNMLEEVLGHRGY